MFKWLFLLNLFVGLFNLLPLGIVDGGRMLQILLHKTIKKVTEDIESFKFNTAISSMMMFLNKLSENENVNKEILEKFLLILSPFAPHIVEELWEKLGNRESIYKEKWPEYNEKFIKEGKVTLIVQINGKVRDKMEVKVNISKDEALKLAKESARIKKYIDGQEVKKVIMIKDRLLNIVI